jgi:hypothetical protein
MQKHKVNNGDGVLAPSRRDEMLVENRLPPATSRPVGTEHQLTTRCTSFFTHIPSLRDGMGRGGRSISTNIPSLRDGKRAFEISNL